MPIKYLEAIEAGRLNILPDDTYMAACISRYARSLSVTVTSYDDVFLRLAERTRAIRPWALTIDASWGAWLRRLRLKSGVPLRFVAEATKIPLHHLEAIEANRFALVPGGLFLRSYIRQYAEVVGLDAASVLRLFDYFTMRSGDFGQLADDLVIASGEAQRIVPVEFAIASASASRAARAGLSVAARVFSASEALAPPRITREELGDALEMMNQEGRSALWIWTKLVSTVFWLLVHAIGDAKSLLAGKGKA